MSGGTDVAATQQSGAHYTARRTEAIPKHTLFGSTIEMHDEEDRRMIRDLDFKEYQAKVDRDRKLKQDRYKVKVPAYLRKSMQEKPLEHTEEELSKQKNQTQRARQLMDLLEEKSKYFDLGQRSVTQDQADMTSYSGQWSGSRDPHKARAMNNVGVGESKGFNYDKYQTKPVMHKYSIAGDPLRLGMDAPLPVNFSLEKKPFYRVERHGPPDRMPREFYMKPATEEQDDPCAIHLPPNIKHQFGTKVCNRLLADPEKVEKTIQNQTSSSKRSSRSSRKGQKQPLPEDEQDPGYKSLGDALRYDFFPGYTQNHKQSLAHSVYTDDVHKQHDPDPDKYRYQRDELSKWAEHNVLRDRMKKAWDSYLADTLSTQKK